MKKILLLLTLLSLMASAQTLIDGFYYDLDTSDNTAAITSIGYNCYSGDIVIPSIVKYEGVTYIVTRINGGFRYCPNLTSVKIPSSVTKIGKGLFYGSENLTTIIVESGNTRYDSRNNCNAIIETKTNTLIEGCKTTVIPNSVTCIGEGAFAFCSRLTSIEIPNSVTTIGNWAFSECMNLTSVTIPSSVTSIGEGTFYECTGLKSVIIPNSVTSIGDEAFLDCINLTSLTIPNSVTSIGDGAFDSCSGLTSVIIPNSVTSIGEGAFAGCSGLTSVEIPNSVTTIGDGAFASCSGLTSVAIPNSVTSIGVMAFSGCSGLKDVYCYEENVPTTNSDAFLDTPISSATLYVTEASIEAYKATAPWNGFGSIVALDIEPVPTYNTCIDGIYYIIDTSAKTATVTSGYSGYTGCVIIPATVTDNDIIYSVTEIGNDAFLQCSGMTSVNIPNSVTVIGNSAFDGCSGLTSVEIPNSVTTIGDGAFASCSGLTSVAIPNSVTSIGTVAFFNCSGLTSVEIPNSVTSIGFMAFSDCPVLNDVYCYAENVPTTNSNAFLNSPISSATLHVPAASVEAYKATAPWNGFGSVVSTGDEPVGKKCAKPTIEFSNGKLNFSCETEGVEFVAKVTCPDSGEYEGSSIPLTTTYIVTVYAKKDGYEDSDVATKEIIVGGAAGIKGDVNEDGTVNGTDIQEVINIIVNAE